MSDRLPVIIAHRGACAYLPEHTLAAKALAHGMGADYLEQDIVLTRDAVPIVLHDIYLESTTDVADKYPKRSRPGGHFYAMDFDLAEVKTLTVHERRRGSAPVYPHRFPADIALFSIPTLAEELSLVAGLNTSRRTETGVYIELKSPNRHRQAGLDIESAVLQALADSPFANRPDQVFLQCFDDKTLQSLHHQHNTPYPLIQLIGHHTWQEDTEADFDALRSPDGLASIASYAAGIGPWLPHVYLGRNETGQHLLSSLVEDARHHDLLVHPYTFRCDELPDGINSPIELLDILFNELGVDGLFTDFTDVVRDYLQGR
ncbi:MAG: glycerophosphodiester phosphodiesterase [Pseudomonadota bacterium]